MFDEDDWDSLRAEVARIVSPGIKEELHEDYIVEAALERVWPIQESIRHTFRDTRHTLESTKSDLLNGVIDPMRDDFLILNVAAAHVRGESTLRYYTYDHRRAWCMHEAGVSKVRLRLVLIGPSFDEFVRKADGLGKRIVELRLRDFGRSSGHLKRTWQPEVRRSFLDISRTSATQVGTSTPGHILESKYRDPSGEIFLVCRTRQHW